MTLQSFEVDCDASPRECILLQMLYNSNDSKETNDISSLGAIGGADGSPPYFSNDGESHFAPSSHIPLHDNLVLESNEWQPPHQWDRPAPPTYHHRTLFSGNYNTEDESTFSDDATWVLMASFIILTMQSGFGLLEMGSSSSGNEINVMMKNVMDVVMGGLAFWLLGFGLAFGEPSNPFMGMGMFAPDVLRGSENYTEGGLLYSSYIFQFSFAATATTILSGAVAMRMRFHVYCLYSFYSVIIYGFVAHWVWADNGWLKNNVGMHDFAGGGPIHLFGGINSAVALCMVGARTGRFDGSRGEKVFRPSSPTSILFGLFMLWWGWVGFITGSTFGITGDKWIVASRSAVVTMNASGAGGFVMYVYSAIVTKGQHTSVEYVVTGILGALVAVTPGADAMTFTEAIVIGSIGSFMALGGNKLAFRLKLDDPVGAIGVHYVASVWGLLSVGLFSDGSLVGTSSGNGLFHGGGWKLLGAQAIGVVSITAWGALCTSAFFFIVGAINSRDIFNARQGLRVDVIHEIQGLDKYEHDMEEKGNANPMSMRRVSQNVDDDPEPSNNSAERKQSRASLLPSAFRRRRTKAKHSYRRSSSNGSASVTYLGTGTFGDEVYLKEGRRGSEVYNCDIDDNDIEAQASEIESIDSDSKVSPRVRFDWPWN